jgi:hypothetical protein
MVDETTLSSVCEINATCIPSSTVANYVRESLSHNTRVAYLSDLAHFESWGGRIPAAPETIAEYLAAHADVLSVATLNRPLAALAKVHRSPGFTVAASGARPASWRACLTRSVAFASGSQYTATAFGSIL